MNELGLRVAVITFDAEARAREYVKRSGLRWPLLVDSNQSLYKSYGMTRGSLWAIYGPPTLWGYLKLISGGRMPGRPGRDWRQLGGDVLIDPLGIVQVHHVSIGPHDRPTVESLLEVINAQSR